MLRQFLDRHLLVSIVVAAMPAALAWTTPQAGETRPLPPRDCSLVVAAGLGQADAALARLRGGMIGTLGQSGLLLADGLRRTHDHHRPPALGSLPITRHVTPETTCNIRQLRRSQPGL